MRIWLYCWRRRIIVGYQFYSYSLQVKIKYCDTIIMRKTAKQSINQASAPKQQKNKKDFFPLVPDEIHKVPDNIRKAIKIGKHRKGLRQKGQPIIEEDDGNDSRTQLQRDPIQVHSNLHVRKIFSFLPKRQEDQEEDNCPENKNSDSPTPLIHLYNMARTQTNKLRTSGDRMLYAKKKLSPLKKGLSIEPRSIPSRDKKSLKVTFLNIEKLQLIKLYQNIEQNNTPQKSYQKTMSMTSSMVNNTDTTAIKTFLQSTTFSNKTPLFRKSFYSEARSPNKKLKPFCPPFERYQYRDLIWKIAYNHSIYFQCPQNYQKKFKVYIGKGNNSLLVKSIFKRRKSWWTFTQNFQQANFIWTQIKNNYIFAGQPNQSPEYVRYPEDLQINKTHDPYPKMSKLVNDRDCHEWITYFNKFRRVEDNLNQTMSKRNKHFSKIKALKQIEPRGLRIHNHLPNNYVIGNKKALFYTMSQYYEKKGEKVFEYLPLTFHIQNGLEDPEYLRFLNSYYERAKKIRARNKKCSDSPDNTSFDSNDNQQKSLKNIWIVKPGQFTNRGNGIIVCLTLHQIKKILRNRQRHDNGNLKTYIIQSYLQTPFLYQRRKFDIRHFIMISSINGIIKGYWYSDGYIRTTSFEYSIDNNFSNVHLTNDAVQKYLPEYGKYQKGNKISYQDFQRYLQKQYKNRYNFFDDIYPKIKKIATDAMKACSLLIDPEKKGHNFEIFGLDFMIDGDFHPWLIEINNNPCLEVNCPLLSEIIPNMLENALRLCIDPLFPPPATFQEKRPKFNGNSWNQNKFQVVYDSSIEQMDMLDLFEGKFKLQLDYKQLQKDQDEVFEDDGNQLDD